uniref:Uncharacterized protein n=1 Tax=Trichogramma kaykai TaxID=54128 RepID=A0ABD2VUV8_9HYME
MKRCRTEEELLYESEDDEPITIRTRILYRLVSSSSSSDMELEDSTPFCIVKYPRDLLKEDIDIDSVIAVSQDLLDLATHEELTLKQKTMHTTPENKQTTAELSK